MSTLTDDFNRADNTDLGASWAVESGETAAQIVSNRVRGTSTSAGAAEYTTNFSGNNLFAYVTLATWGGSASATLAAGVMLRAIGALRTYYGYRAQRSNQSEIFKYNSGTFTSLSQVSTTWAANDQLLATVFGSRQVLYQNGVQQTESTDTALSGFVAAGLLVGNASGAGSVADVEIDDFYGGDLSADLQGNPTSDVSATGTWTQSAPNRYTFVDDYPSQVTTDVLVHGTTTPGRIIFGSGSPGLGGTAIAAGVTLAFYGYKGASQGNNITPSLYIGTSPTNHDGTAITTLGNGAAAIARFAQDLGLNPKSSAPWTVSEINGSGTNGLVGFGFVSTDANPAITITSAALLVSYAPANVFGAAAAYDQDSFRFRNDDGSQTGASWVAALNTNASLDVDTNYRLRLLIQNTGAAAGTDVALQWQYNLASAGWNDITTSSSVVRAVASANFTDGDDCTQQLGSGTFHSNNDGMTEDGTAGGANLDLTNGQEMETELCFQILSADVTDAQTIEFRISGMDTYTRTPVATVVEAGAPVVGPSRGSLMMTGAGR